jgi:hypothetical protein
MMDLGHTSLLKWIKIATGIGTRVTQTVAIRGNQIVLLAFAMSLVAVPVG